MSGGHGSVKAAAIVTGGASGIGRATVEQFVERGLGVVAVDLSLDRFDWIPTDAPIVPLALDVTDEPSNTAMTAAAVQHFGRLDVAVLNAGMPGGGTIENLDSKPHRYEITIDYRFGNATDSEIIAVPTVAAGATAEFHTHRTIVRQGGVQCTVASVTGPTPFAPSN